MTKPNKDGWIMHRGGECPSNVTDRIDVRFRDGAIGVFRCPITLKWVHEQEEYDIMAWRPHKPEQVTAEQSLDVEMPAAKYFDGPLQWRDRIREIDAASKEEEARHCAAMAAYDAERASLVSKLKAEGFALIQNDEPNGGEESAKQDMSDWRNWKEGDIVRIEEDLYGHGLPVGSELAIGKIEWLGREGIRMTIRDRFLHEDEVEFVSRPTN